MDVSGWTNPVGKLIVRGHAVITDGTEITKLVAENRGASASCAAADGGQAELVMLTIPFRHNRSSERIQATIVPRDEVPIDQPGEYRATLEFDGGKSGSFEVTLVVGFDGRVRRAPVGVAD